MKIEINITKQHLASLIFSLAIVVGIQYAVAQTGGPDPGHSPGEIGPGTFAGGGDYIFPGDSRVGITSDAPGIWLDEIGGSNDVFLVTHNNIFQVQKRQDNFGAFVGSPFVIDIDAPHASFSMDESGNISFSNHSITDAYLKHSDCYQQALSYASGGYRNTWCKDGYYVAGVRTYYYVLPYAYADHYVTALQCCRL
jgi:hypothetical protein